MVVFYLNKYLSPFKRDALFKLKLMFNCENYYHTDLRFPKTEIIPTMDFFTSSIGLFLEKYAKDSINKMH